MAYALHSRDGASRPTPHQWALAPAAGLTALWTALLLVGAAGPGRTADGDHCLRCHGMRTLARRTPTGEVQSLAVDARAFAQSDHRRLPCTECHGTGYRQFPHPPSGPNLTCAGCHLQRLRPRAPASLLQASRAFRQSVHAQPSPHGLTCRSCHDPHAFRRHTTGANPTTGQQNAVCLRCHPIEAPRKAAHSTVADARRAHRWLPHSQRHLEHVRCLDCHADGTTPGSSHRILPARQAVRDCVACHSGQSILRHRPPHSRGAETMARLGFQNAAVLSHSYVVGATRNRFVDRLGVVLVLGTMAAASAHGSLRIWAARRRRKVPRPSDAPSDQEAQR